MLSEIDSRNGDAESSQWNYYMIEGKFPHKLSVEMDVISQGSDLGLYITKDSLPDFNKYDCRPYLGKTQPHEACHDLEGDSDTTWFIGIHGFSFDGGSYELSSHIINEVEGFSKKSWKFDWILNEVQLIVKNETINQYTCKLFDNNNFLSAQGQGAYSEPVIMPIINISY